jgi:Zn-dependent protease
VNSLVDCPQSHFGEWDFPLLGSRVQVKIWFWAACLITCMGRDSVSGILIWVAVCFVSVLLHELGHVCAFRMAGTRADIVLYGWGGLTVPYRGGRGSAARVGTALAGSAAGFGVTALLAAAAHSAGWPIHLGWHWFLPSLAVFPASPIESFPMAYVVLNDLLYVNLYWGLVNLLPVYPLDGSLVARVLFERFDDAGAMRRSLQLSAAAALAAGLVGVLLRNGYLMILFAILAVSSFQKIEEGSPRSTRW